MLSRDEPDEPEPLEDGKVTGQRRLLEHEDLSRAILPTLPAWTNALDARRVDLIRAFGRSRPVDGELDQLLAHMGALQRAFEEGELFYEVMVFRAGFPRSPRA